MTYTTRGRFRSVLVALSSCLIVVACGAEPDDTATATTASASADVEISASAARGVSSTARVSSTSTTRVSSTSTNPGNTSPTSDPIVPSTTVAQTATSTSVADPSSTTAAPAPTGNTGGPSEGPVESVPTLEVVDDGQGAVSRVPAGQNWAPFATFDEVTLIQPSIRIERIGFHESNHDGARQLEPTPEAIAPIVMESRQRDTGSRTAADIVVEPGTEIRAPVTGTVLRAGGYVLYCDHQDDFLVIEPDSRPGWEVKLLHINGVMVTAGDRVEAGVTVVAPEATVLPFDSQVDRFTATPPWPHVHIELVDPSIPDRPSTGGGC